MLNVLIEHAGQPFDLIVVTGGYPADLVAALRSRVDAVGGRTIELPAYVTPNEARNAALEITKTDYIVFLEHDVHIDGNWLPPLLACARETGAAIVSSLIFELEPLFTRLHMVGGEARVIPKPKGGTIYHDVPYEIGVNDEVMIASIERRRTELADLHSVLVEVAWLRSVGGLDPDLLSLSEHWDMCIAAAQTGREIYLEPLSRANYVPPTKPTADDVRWFSVRWSNEWNDRSIARLCDKYGMDANEGSFAGVHEFLKGHRQHRFIPLQRKFTRYMGSSVGRYVFNRFARPIFEILEKPRIRRDLRRWEAQRNNRGLWEHFLQQ